MPQTLRPFAPAILFAGVFLSVLSACGNRSPATSSPAGSTSAAASSTVARYHVLGVVDALPDPSRVGEIELQIHHERIPDFKDKSGKIVGMNEMVMGFPAGPGVKLPELKVGDKVEFDFEVTWDGAVPYYLTSIRRLDPATPVKLTK